LLDKGRRRKGLITHDLGWEARTNVLRRRHLLNIERWGNWRSNPVFGYGGVGDARNFWN